MLRTECVPRDQAAALFAGAGRKSLVVAATPAARSSGVEPGLTAPQAIARCPGLLIRTPSIAAEAEARAALLAVALTISPRVEDTLPGVCTIDLKGASLADCPALSRRAVQELDRLALTATAGIGRTPLIALYAARVAQPVLVVEDEGGFLAPLPLAFAGPSSTLAAILADWGLRTLGDVSHLPRDEFVRRCGAEGLAFWRRAAGGDVRPLRPYAAPQIFSAAMEFEAEVETLEPLLFVIRRFLDRLTLELNAAQCAAAEIMLALRFADGPPHDRSFRLPAPTADPAILFRAVHTHLESLQTASAIRAVELQLSPTRPLLRQAGLLETGLRDPHGFAETLARVVALVGSDRVGTPQVQDTHRPDTVKLAPPSATVPAPAAPPAHPLLGAPLRRFRPPLPARLEFTGRRPSYLWTERLQGEIASHAGPWQSSGDWWQPELAWRRSEWDIALAGGGLYRLILVGGAYYVEGEYD